MLATPYMKILQHGIQKYTAPLASTQDSVLEIFYFTILVYFCFEISDQFPFETCVSG